MVVVVAVEGVVVVVVVDVVAVVSVLFRRTFTGFGLWLAEQTRRAWVALAARGRLQTFTGYGLRRAEQT